MKKTIPVLFLALAFILAGLAASANAMGRIPKKEYEAKVAELERTKADCAAREDALKSELNETRSRMDSVQSANDQLLKDMNSSKSELQQRVAEFTREKQELEKAKAEEVDKVKNTYDTLVSDMKKEIEQGSIQITQLQDKLSVSMVDKIVFNSGEAEVNEQGKQVLKRVANILKKVKDKQIRIEGHTDNIPIGGALKDRFPSNWELSTARATSVARYLEEAGGVEPKLLSAAGYSQYKAVADNSTPEGRSKNRRIEIVMVPMDAVQTLPVKKIPQKP